MKKKKNKTKKKRKQGSAKDIFSDGFRKLFQGLP